MWLESGPQAVLHVTCPPFTPHQRVPNPHFITRLTTAGPESQEFDFFVVWPLLPTTKSPMPHTLPSPAAFGLTVIEAMTCGLPTFATNHGGPSEIIKHKKSGE